MEDNNKLEKIFFHLVEDHYSGSSTESLWAKKINANTFQLENSPFYVNKVSYKDIIEANYDRTHELVFKKIIKHLGHSTYRIFLFEESIKLFSKYWLPFEKSKCTFEQLNNNLYSIDVPKEANIYEVYRLLEKGEKDKVWDFEEGHCGHPLN